MKIFIAIVVAAAIVSAPGPFLAGPGEPPQVTIYTIPEMEEVSFFQVFLGESFSLLAGVDGDDPMTYIWLSEGDSIGGGSCRRLHEEECTAIGLILGIILCP